MKLIKMLKTQIAAALVLIMLLFGSIFYLSLLALNEQQSYNLTLNITTRLEQTAQNLVTLGLNYSMNVPQDSASYERDVKLYYRAMVEQMTLLDKITQSFMSEEFAPDLTSSDSSFQPHLEPETQRAVLAVEELWIDFRGGITKALGHDDGMPRLDAAADYIARYHAPLVASIDILLNRIQQQTEQELKQVYQWHITLLFCAVLITLGVFGWFYLVILKPLRCAVDGFQKVAQGDFGYQVPITRDNELAMMTRSFNTLSQRLHAIFRLIDQIQRGSDLHETLGFVAKEFPALLPLDWIGVLFVAPDNSTIVLEDSYRDGEAEITRRSRYQLEHTLLLKALESGEPLHIPNMPETGRDHAEFHFLNDLIDMDLKDAIFLPIRELSPIPGVLAFATRVGNSYTEEHLELLTNIAGLIAHSFGRTVKLAEHSRLAAIGGFASGIAHEIRSPLSTISMALDYIQGSELSEAADKRVKLAVKESERMTRLLEEMLLYAKPLQLDLEPFDLRMLLQEVVKDHHLISSECQVVIEPDDSKEAWGIRGDRDRMTQVLINLLSNARDALPADESILCRLERNNSSSLILSLFNGGTPIPDEHLEKLFEPFFTTKQHGTGLGLAIVKRIIEGHGGEIGITSSETEGTCVRVVLPNA